MYLAPVQFSLSNDVDQQNCGMLLSVDFSSPSLAWHLPVSLEPSRLLHSEPLPHLYSGTLHNTSTEPLSLADSPAPGTQAVPLMSAVVRSLH